MRTARGVQSGALVKSLYNHLLRLVPSFAAMSLVAAGCSSASTGSGTELYPDEVGERTGALSSCGTALVAWNGSTAYSNGNDTGTGESCAGNGTYGLQYQCVELVMRHFNKNWGLSWYGNAEDLLDNAPSGSVNVYKNGDVDHPPVPGDMIVFGGGSVGHVALVTEVTASQVTIIEQNVPSSYTRKLALSNGKVSPGWNNWWTMGWAHAKANGDGGGQVGDPPVSWNCGASAYNGKQYWTCDGGSLHKCDGGSPVVTDCGALGCTVGAVGTDDTCNAPAGDPPADPPADPPNDPPADPPNDPPAVDWACGDSAYNGSQYWTCKGDSRYRCESGTPVEDACEQGCMSRSVGTDDLCISNASGWSCGDSAYNGGQYWTCVGGDIYKCSGGAPQKVDCPSGCVVHALGTDDACN